VDRSGSVGADLVWDLEAGSLPLPSSSFDEILALDVLEHVSDVPAFLEESNRLLAPAGELRITTPHFSCSNSFTDPTHRHHFGWFSFDYFVTGHPLAHYSAARFEVVHRLLVFRPTRLNRFVSNWANRNPERYERRWAWIFPAWFLDLRLRKVGGEAPLAEVTRA
jgi:SAM-dependent methyltransferase